MYLDTCVDIYIYIRIYDIIFFAPQIIWCKPDETSSQLLCKKNSFHSTLISSLCRTISVPKMTSTSINAINGAIKSMRSIPVWKIRCQADYAHSGTIRWNMKLVSNFLVSIVIFIKPGRTRLRQFNQSCGKKDITGRGDWSFRVQLYAIRRFHWTLETIRGPTKIFFTKLPRDSPNPALLRTPIPLSPNPIKSCISQGTIPARATL